jgi:CheY-like chemotaxis protein
MESAHLHGKGQQLLVVDDERVFAAYVQEKFEHLGYTVLIAEDAFEALAFVARVQAPLVVVLDLMLPGMSGHQLLRELAKSPRASAIRVVLVSAHHTVERVAANHPLVLGRAHKPIDLGELTRMVDGAAAELALQRSDRAGGP